MTGPIQFNPNLNPFQGVGGTENLQEIQDRRQTLRFPDLDLSPVNLDMNQGQDLDGEIALDNFDFKLDKQIPKQ